MSVMLHVLSVRSVVVTWKNHIRRSGAVFEGVNSIGPDASRASASVASTTAMLTLVSASGYGDHSMMVDAGQPTVVVQRVARRCSFKDRHLVVQDEEMRHLGQTFGASSASASRSSSMVTSVWMTQDALRSVPAFAYADGASDCLQVVCHDDRRDARRLRHIAPLAYDQSVSWSLLVMSCSVYRLSFRSRLSAGLIRRRLHHPDRPPMFGLWRSELPAESTEFPPAFVIKILGVVSDQFLEFVHRPIQADAELVVRHPVLHDSPPLLRLAIDPLAECVDLIGVDRR